jgi:hypothetical protein
MSVRPTFPQTTGDSIADLRAKLSSTTLALHETLDSVMAAFDKHSQELDTLRRALVEAESALKVTAPQVAAVMKPMPMLPELPKALEPLPKLAIPSMPPLPAPAPAARHPATGPMMTQILWPSKDNTAAEAFVPTPAPVPAPAPSARKADAPMLISAPAPVEPPAPPSPDLEQATLEELNAALAYAFSQVSNTTSLGKGAVTQMMPAPLPTQAMRFGSASELAGRF